MAKYIFQCSVCEERGHRYVTSKTIEQTCPKCSGVMNRELPTTNSTEVRETIDTYTNKRWSKDHTAIMKDRRDNHYWDVEVPRLIETHSVQTSLEQGWLVYNDKGELVINKPPSKR